MEGSWATDFWEIPDVLEVNQRVRERTLSLSQNDPLQGKVLEGDDRKEDFREILSDLITGENSIDSAVDVTRRRLSEGSSPHAGDGHVFSQGWDKRLVRTQLSRFYNQAVLDILREEDIQECYIPHSSTEKGDSPCTQTLAGQVASTEELYRRLIQGHRHGEWPNEPFVPNHPHCTHVVTPIEEEGNAQNTG